MFKEKGQISSMLNKKDAPNAPSDLNLTEIKTRMNMTEIQEAI